MGNIQNELSQIALLQAGFFRGISKKAKAAKEEEATGRLHAAERELELARKDFAAEQKNLDEEYARMKLSMEEQMTSQLKTNGESGSRFFCTNQKRLMRFACEIGTIAHAEAKSNCFLDVCNRSSFSKYFLEIVLLGISENSFKSSAESMSKPILFDSKTLGLMFLVNDSFKCRLKLSGPKKVGNKIWRSLEKGICSSISG